MKTDTFRNNKSRQIRIRTAILDASSAIILCKAGLHSLLTEIYDIILPQSVYNEITANPYIGAAEYARLAAESKIRLREVTSQEGVPGINGLDPGECDAIHLFKAGAGDFIITDDGPAARYCKKKSIPFINALLFPVVLRFAKVKDEEFCRTSMAEISGIGRYSRQIITFAGEWPEKTISFALPC